MTTIYTVVLLACLSADLSECKTHERAIEASPIPTTAFMDAQSYVAWWAGEHPDWHVIKWHMAPGRGA